MKDNAVFFYDTNTAFNITLSTFMIKLLLLLLILAAVFSFMYVCICALHMYVYWRKMIYITHMDTAPYHSSLYLNMHVDYYQKRKSHFHFYKGPKFKFLCFKTIL